MISLREAIRGYQASTDDFNRNAPNDDDGANAYAEQSYKPHLEVLTKWDMPAQNIEEAIEALRISQTDQGGVYGCQAANSMVKAALGYVEQASTISTETSLYRLFSIYWDRYEAHSRAMSVTDRTGYDTPEREAAKAAQFSASDHIDEVTYAICAFVPEHRFEAQMKAGFLRDLAAGNGGRLGEEEFDALLSSLPDLVHWESREARS